jgi:hypothetical protein
MSERTFLTIVAALVLSLALFWLSDLLLGAVP